jgi:hypothetical protein
MGASAVLKYYKGITISFYRDESTGMIRAGIGRKLYAACHTEDAALLVAIAEYAMETERNGDNGTD